MTAPVILPRLMSVAVGPPGAAGLLFTAEDMEAEVKGFKGSKPNECSVTIYNLSKATISQLEAPGQVLQLQAGEGFVGQLFYGSIAKRGVVTTNEQPTRKTKITARDGRRVYRDTRVARSYPPNTPVAQVIQDLLVLATAQGVTLGTGSVFPAGSFPAGWAHNGLWRQAMTEILSPRGYYWTIEGHVIYVLLESGYAPGNIPRVSPLTGLNGSPTRTDKGCDISAKLDPAIRSGHALLLESAFFTGLYRVALHTHKLSRNGLIWETTAKCEVIK